MNSFLFLILFLSATLRQPFVSPNSKLEAICTKVADLIPSTAAETYNFCITSLQVFTANCPSTDGPDLTLLSCNLTKANYTHNLNLTLELLASRGVADPARPALEACATRYRAGIEDLRRGIRSIESGELNRALFSLQEAWKRAVACDEDLKGVVDGEGVLMRKENSDALGLVDIAIKLVLLHKL